VALALEGKSALVTGASKGIGLGMATAFAQEGAAVMISSRKQEGLDAAAAGIQEIVPGARVETFAANAGEPDQAEACVAATVERLGSIEYEDFVASGDPAYLWQMPDDEWDAITLNYTSGTTGDPKGVVYHHRGAHLLAMGNIITCGMRQHPVYLWTLPMFHCNGWCFPWTVSIVAGTHVCLRQVDPAQIFPLIERHKVTHMSGAPIVLNMLIHAPDEVKRTFAHGPVDIATGGAAEAAAGGGPLGPHPAASSATSGAITAAATIRLPSRV